MSSEVMLESLAGLTMTATSANAILAFSNVVSNINAAISGVRLLNFMVFSSR
jgi:hypothetical protein